VKCIDSYERIITGKKISNNLEKNLLQYHLTSHHKPQSKSPRTEPTSTVMAVSTCLSYGTA
jgi:hypothetical protein